MAAHRSSRVVEHETISVLMLNETEKAYLVVDDDDNEYWIPKSLAEVIDHNDCDEMVIKLPTWVRESANRELAKHTQARFAAQNAEAYRKQREKIASWKRACQGNGL